MSTLTAPLGFKDATLVGVGATSRVYRAVWGRTGQAVALKRLHRQLVQSDEALARLKRELEALSKLRHPSLIRLFDVVRWDGDPTLVMDFVPGEDLHEKLLRGPLAPAEAETILRALLDVVAAAHGAGIVHRDIKPQNVRLSSDGQVYLLDFGSARLDAASQLTQTGTTVGSPEFMAPELFIGPVYDPRADLYGIGATLYAALTGQPPHTADSLAELASLRSQNPPKPVQKLQPEVPFHLAQVVDRMLAIAPEDRYATATLALWALEHPRLELAHQARKKGRPICVGCHTALDPQTIRCPVCKRHRPFQYAPGGHAVYLEAVKDTKATMDHLLSLVPELATKDGVLGLADRIAMLPAGRQCIAFGLSKEDAKGLVEDLSQVGALARAEPVVKHYGAPAALIGAMAGVITTTAVFNQLGIEGTNLWSIGLYGGGALGWAAGFARTLFMGRGSLMSNSKLPVPSFSQRIWAALGAAGVGALFYSTLAPIIDGATSPGVFAGCLAGLTASAGALSFLALKRARLRSTPEPQLKAQARGIMQSLGDSPKKTTRKRTLSAPMQAAIGGLLLVMVPLEAGWLVSQYEEARRLRARQQRWEWNPQRGAMRPTEDMRSPFRESALKPQIRAHGLAAGATAALVGASMMGLMLGAAGFRRRRLKGERDILVEECGPELLATHAGRMLPERTAPRIGQAAQLAAMTGAAGFTEGAIVRATELAHHLPPAAAARLQAQIQAMAKTEDDEAQASLMARCISETDPAWSTRLRFLELEGAAEAQAAQAWAKKLDKEDS